MDTKWPSKEVIRDEMRSARRRIRQEAKLIIELRKDLLSFEPQTQPETKPSKSPEVPVPDREDKRPVEEVASI